MDWNRPDQTCYLQRFWVQFLLIMEIYTTGYGTEFVLFNFFFSASKAYGVTLQVRVEESVYVCVSNYFVLKQI